MPQGGIGYPRNLTSWDDNDWMMGLYRLTTFIANVKDYGAKGDGATDDAAAIQAAVDALPAGYGGIVFLPPGQYVVGSQITLPSTKRGVFRGQGPRATELQLKAAATNDILLVDGQFWRVEDLSIDGNFPNCPGGGHGIKVANTKVWLSNLWVSNCKLNGIYVVGTGGQTAHAAFLSNVYCNTNQQDGIEFGAFAFDAQCVNVWSGANVRDGIRVGSSNVALTNCHAWGNTANGLHIMGVDATRANACYFETNSGRGIRLESGSRYSAFNACVIRGNTGGQGLYVFGATSVLNTMAGCVVYNNGSGAGVRVDTATDFTIAGCTFFDNQGGKTQTHAVDSVNGADRVTISGSSIRAANHLTGSTNLVGAANVLTGNQA